MTDTVETLSLQLELDKAFSYAVILAWERSSPTQTFNCRTPC